MSTVSAVLHLIAWGGQVVIVAVAVASVRSLFQARSGYRYPATLALICYICAFNWPPSPYLVDVSAFDAYNRVAFASLFYFTTRKMTKRTGWAPLRALSGREHVQLYPRRPEW